MTNIDSGFGYTLIKLLFRPGYMIHDYLADCHCCRSFACRRHTNLRTHDPEARYTLKMNTLFLKKEEEKFVRNELKHYFCALIIPHRVQPSAL